MQDQEKKTQDHARAALRLLEDADREFGKCNIGETSEKLWEAASNAIKAVCVRRGWQHEEYTHFREAMQLLLEETGDKSLYTGFRIAYNGHLFVGSMDDDDVDTDRPVVRRFVDQLLAVAGVDAE